MAQQVIKIISSYELLAETLHLKNEGFRLVAITCAKASKVQDDPADEKDKMEVTYSFEKDYEFINLRVIADDDVELESISAIYAYSFLYENEIKELFGVKIKGISVDFHEALYKIPVKTPFATVKEDK